MPLFDAYLMVDWSASSVPKQGADSIWWAYIDREYGPEASRNPYTREDARRDIIERLNAAFRGNRRVLLGFDFPFGYPRGTAKRVVGEPSWERLWGYLSRGIADAADNRNNRYDVAVAMNAAFDGIGPFWGHPHQHIYAGLSLRRPPSSPAYPPARRHVEERIPGAKTVWQLSGAGSVGSQSLLGIPFLMNLIDDPALIERPVIWPFETGLALPTDRRSVIAEIYPSIIKIAPQPGIHRDQTQVETLARWFADWDADGNLRHAFELPHIIDEAIRADIVAEEGFILGEACERPDLKPSRHCSAPVYLRDPGEITRRSFAIIAAEADLSALPADIAPVAARVVHACGMPDVVDDLAFSPGAGAAGLAALDAGAAILCDVRMVAAGLMTSRLVGNNAVHVCVDQPGASEFAARTGQTRTAAGLELLAGRFGGAIVVIGNAPTALFRLLELMAAGAARPALVLGFPVGFVGAAESKAALAAGDLGLPFIALSGRRGGSAMAAAAMNALILGGAAA